MRGEVLGGVLEGDSRGVRGGASEVLRQQFRIGGARRREVAREIAWLHGA